MGRIGNCTWAQLVVSLALKAKETRPSQLLPVPIKWLHCTGIQETPAVTSALEKANTESPGTAMFRPSVTTFTGTGRTAVQPQQELPTKPARSAVQACSIVRVGASFLPQQPGRRD